MHGGRLLSQIWGVGIRCAGRSGYTLRVVREVRCVLSRRLKLANVLDSLSAASNSFQIIGVEKLKERLLKLVGRKEHIKDSDRLREDGMYVQKFSIKQSGWHIIHTQIVYEYVRTHGSLSITIVGLKLQLIQCKNDYLTRSSCKSQMIIWASRSRELREVTFSLSNFFSSS